AIAFLLYLVVRVLARILCCGRSDRAKDLEIVVLRHQLNILRRTRPRPRWTSLDRALLVAVAGILPRERWTSFLVGPRTLLRWHRELVSRKWTYGRTGTPGHPPIDPEVTELILRMARENPRWGCVRIRGEV